MKNKLFVLALPIFALFCFGSWVSNSPACATYQDNCNPSPSVSPTPTVEVSPTPTETVTPTPECDQDQCITPTPTEEVTPTPTEEPTVTPTPTEEPKGESNPPTFAGSSTDAPGVCADTKPSKVANIYVKTTGNKGELEVQWALPSGGDRVHIEYGLQKDAQHALLNTPNDGNEIIRNLASGQHYWFRVAGVNGCAVGDYSDWYDPLVP